MVYTHLCRDFRMYWTNNSLDFFFLNFFILICKTFCLSWFVSIYISFLEAQRNWLNWPIFFFWKEKKSLIIIVGIMLWLSCEARCSNKVLPVPSIIINSQLFFQLKRKMKLPSYTAYCCGTRDKWTLIYQLPSELSKWLSSIALIKIKY